MQAKCTTGAREVNPIVSATARRWVWSVLLVASGALAACTTEPDVPLSAVGEEGRQIARSSGCSSCHGKQGQGGTGPAWKGLAGSTVTFTDFTTAVADEDYLTRSIADPKAQTREGFAIKMPENQLTDTEIAKVVAYIQEIK